MHLLSVLLQAPPALLKVLVVIEKNRNFLQFGLFRLIILTKSKQKVKVKRPDIYIPPVAGKPEQQRFTIRSGVLTSTSSRRRGAYCW